MLLPTDLGVQFGVGVGLTSPHADLHHAVHVLLHQLVVVQQLHGLAGALRAPSLQRTQQRLPQVVQVVQVDGLPAAQRPAAGREQPIAIHVCRL